MSESRDTERDVSITTFLFIVIFPFLDGDVPRATSCGVHFSQFVLLDHQVKSVAFIIEIKF